MSALKACLVLCSSIGLLPALGIYFVTTSTFALFYSIFQVFGINYRSSSPFQDDKSKKESVKKESVSTSDAYDDLCITAWMFFFMTFAPLTTGTFVISWMLMGFSNSSHLNVLSKSMTGLVAVYLLWSLVLDKTVHHGGLMTTRYRTSRFWKHIASYFSITMSSSSVAVSSQDSQGVSPKERVDDSAEESKNTNSSNGSNYIFCYHPHGILFWGVIGALLGFTRPDFRFRGKTLTELNMRLATINFNVQFPILRDLCKRIGCIAVTWQSLNAALSKGLNVFLVPGGAQESIYALPGTFKVMLKRRRGFVRLALKQGLPLVPIIAYGENDMFNVLELQPGSILYEVQQIYQRCFGFTVPIFWGRTICGIPTVMPMRRPIHIVFGEPIQVDQYNGDLRSDEGRALTEHVYKMYVDNLTSLYHKHKHLWTNRKEDIEIM